MMSSKYHLCILKILLAKKLYDERLRILNLPTLKYRRYRGDMIELFKMIKGIYDPMCIPCVEFRELTEDLIRTRGNRLNLFNITVIMI